MSINKPVTIYIQIQKKILAISENQKKTEHKNFIAQLNHDVDEACLNLLQTNPSSPDFENIFAQTLLLFQKELGEYQCFQLLEQRKLLGLQREDDTMNNFLTMYKEIYYQLDLSVTQFSHRLSIIFQQEETDQQTFSLIFKQLHSAIIKEVEKPQNDWSFAVYNRAMNGLQDHYTTAAPDSPTPIFLRELTAIEFKRLQPNNAPN